MSALILYYSYGGNTRRIAQLLSKELGADLLEIQPVTPYTSSYNEVVDQGQREVEAGYMPPIQPLPSDLSAYNTIVLGSPVWWYTFAPAMKTCLSELDFSGKTVWPFATNGGWLGHTLNDFAAACPGAQVMPGLDIRFDEHTLRTPEDKIVAWARGIRS